MSREPSSEPRPRDRALELLDFEDLHRLLKIAPRTARNWISAGIVPPPIKVGPGRRKLLRWRRAEIEAWIEKGCPLPEVKRPRAGGRVRKYQEAPRAGLSSQGGTDGR